MKRQYEEPEKSTAEYVEKEAETADMDVDDDWVDDDYGADYLDDLLDAVPSTVFTRIVDDKSKKS